MKTLKLKITGLALQLKKIFFKHGDLNTTNCNENIVKENITSKNEVDKMRFDEYLTVYKNITRWQTV